jgi:hypothetical protein
MSPSQWLKRLAPILLSLTLLVASCSTAPSKYDQVQDETTGFRAPAAVDKKAEQGSTFNKFFPGSQGSYQVIPSQEKKGFAEYKLNRDGKTVAMLTINDTTSLPTAAAKYNDATETIAGYPTVDQGTTATGLLVNGRYQVKVLSRDPAFAKEDRVAWLQKFDLKGLAQLKGSIVKPQAVTPAASQPTAPVSSQPTTAATNQVATPEAAKPDLKLPKIELPNLVPELQPAA